MRAALLLLIGLIIPVMAIAAPPAPQTLVIISCRVDDRTAEGRWPMASPNWKDLEWHLDKGNELECKREVLPLEDAVAAFHDTVKPLASDFSDVAQCAHAGAMVAPGYQDSHPGWAVMAVGCPVRIETDGVLTGWKLPDCPSEIGGLPIKCRFDGSLI